jgi:hypothetical protein
MDALNTISAAKVANLDRQRLNEYIAAGDYRCAPETVSGRTRLFDEEDLIALFIFARMLERGHRPKAAGKIAEQILKGLRDQPGAERILIGENVAFTGYWYGGKSIELPSADFAGNRVLGRTEYDVAAVREIVRRRATSTEILAD